MPDEIARTEEAAIAEFHLAARKRKAVIFAVAAVVCLLFGGLVVVIALTSVPADPAIGVMRFAWKALLLGGVMIAAGGASALTAYRIGTGKIVDAEM